MNKQRATALGLTAGLLGGGAAGLLLGVPALTSAAGDGVAVVAQQDDTTDDTTGDTTTDDTTSDTTTDDTTSDTTTDDTTSDEATADHEPGERIRAALQDLVDAGTITTEQADAVAAHLAEQLPARGGHRGGRPGGHGAFDGEVVAGLLGITPEALRDALRDGSSISELAEANGVEIQTVIDALVAEAREHVQLAVTAGRLTQAEADEKLADITERITEMVDRSRPAD
jgi:polyhydroxyalkanoate synthesis regulator phasin